MPSQHSRATTPVTVRPPIPVVQAARVRLAAEGQTMKALVEHALTQYAAGAFTLPPPDAQR